MRTVAAEFPLDPRPVDAIEVPDEGDDLSEIAWAVELAGS
jgi:hypothetical protein